ncbi:helix-turn-helix domain-containing protein [Pseudomonas sp.]|jgi:transcriptional regulator with XRE-family HTH domain|uniref:helix-turn-helix domain-containing protein n=1 Tax=Pseudomonas sp. TaxID=306 RepID=UPI0037C53BF5
MESEILWFLPMHFPARLIQLRKAADLTQQALADAATLHVNQIRRYEAGTAQPTLEALIRLAQVLHVSLDDLVFGEDERGPSEDLRLRFEAVSHMPEQEKAVIKELLDAMILKHQTKRFFVPQAENGKTAGH